MEHKKVLGVVMFVMVATRLSSASSDLPLTCKGYEILILYCTPYLSTPGFNFKPSTPCCKGATYAFNKAMADKTDCYRERINFRT
ncbi:hypothetical protein CR513_41851, partial [Mucuna pruriens]